MAKLTREDIYKTAKELSNWGRWGDDDQIGTLNNISPEDIVAAAGLVKRGKVFALGLDL
ncbi:MAG: cyclase family protein, partial [Silicimonas sp.]|nr:cyclase family protein [Silicimonas sp.]